MADLTQTATAVFRGGSDADVFTTYFASATITAGDLVALVTADGTVVQARDTTSALANLLGIALNGGVLGQPIVVQSKGTVEVGAGGTVAVGQIYVVSRNLGKIAPYADLQSGRYLSPFGYGITEDIVRIFDLQTLATGIQKV